MSIIKHYYYADKDQQFGPFTVDELKSKRLKKNTLVWTDGMTDWDTADNVEELKNILVSEPPPLPKRNNPPPPIETVQIKHVSTPAQIFNSKYDISYTKETEATVYGVMLFIAMGIINFLISNGVIEIGTDIRPLFAIGLLILRIWITVVVVNIASRQNRNSTGWGWFAFFLPSIALIVIGQLKKLRLKIELDGSLPVNHQVSILLEKANKLFSNDRYSECVEILNKTIEIDNHNFDCIELRGLANYELKDFEKSKQDFEILSKNEKYLSTAYYYLGNIAIVGKDRELAVSHWLKAAEQNNENAKRKLDLFHTFSYNYLLSNAQVNKKINRSSTEGYIFTIIDIKYQSGLSQIDHIEKINSLSVNIYGCTNGIHIELKKIIKKYHLGIAYYEIDNIVFNEKDEKLELHLSDKNILAFYGKKFYAYNSLKKLCENFERETGKTPDAASIEKVKQLNSVDSIYDNLDFTDYR